MGCDIHAYVEYRNDYNDKENWNNFGGRINPGRHYGVFAKLVGVCNYDGYDIKPLSEPKGLPTVLSWVVKYDNQIYITKEAESCANECTTEQAERWIKSGYSERVDENHVTHPDWHSHSWCTADELEEVFNDPKTQFNKEQEVEYVALLDLMRSFERQGKKTRLVFWFDN